jgi:aminopeptidase N
MRIITLLIFSICFFTSKAQIDRDLSTIIENEKKAYSRLNSPKPLGTNQDVNFAPNSNFDVKFYRCEWEVTPAIRYINGKVTVYYTITSATNTIIFDLMNTLLVDSVTQRKNKLVATQNTNTVSIDLGTIVNIATLDSISIYYKGIPANTGFGSFIQDVHAGTPVIWTLSEPYGARDWWPCKNGLDDKADSIEISIINPVAYKGVSNGLLQSETLIAGDTKRVSRWKHKYPVASYLICMAVTNYVVFNETFTLSNSILPFQTYCYPESLVEFRSGTANLAGAMQQFDTLFGDYPYKNEKYGQTQFGWGGGMEHQTNSFVTGVNENLTSHELAHQWFGDKITCGSWQDIWLNEGFATYANILFREKKYDYRTLYERQRDINTVTAQPGGSVWVADTSDVNRIFDYRLTYIKGSRLLHMLRWKLGESVFFKAIKAYINDPQLVYKYARTDDLKIHLEKESGVNLTEFFKDWFYGQGYPSYKVTWNMVGSTNVNIKMEQTQSHTSVSFFEMPVPLTFKNATQEKTIIVDNKFNNEIFFKNIGFVPDTVLVDPELWLISKGNSTLKIANPNTTLNSIQVFPNPIQDYFSIYLQNIASTDVTAILYNGLGQKIWVKNIPIIGGANFVTIPCKELPSGEYILKIIGNNGLKFIKRLIK